MPRGRPEQWWVWRAHIDTGSPVTIAGSGLAHDLLEHHIKLTGRPRQYERFSSATGHPLTVAPVEALVRVPLAVPLSAASQPPRGSASPAVGMRVAAGIEDESQPDDAGNRTITLKNWGDCDVLVGMDLLSQFRLTIEHGTVAFDLPQPPARPR